MFDFTEYNFEEFFTNLQSYYADPKNTKLLQPKIPTHLLDDLMLYMSENVELVKDRGKISTSMTLRQVKEPGLRAAIQYIAENKSRSNLYYGTTTENANYCALVPLFMSAFKRFKDVGYEEWDKTDPHFKYALGFKMYDDIMPLAKLTFDPQDIKDARKRALLSPSGRKLAPTQWPAHNIMLGKRKLTNANLARHILLQTWMANVELRNELMILDLNNFDNIPDAIDSSTTEVMEEFTGKKIATTDWPF